MAVQVRAGLEIPGDRRDPQRGGQAGAWITPAPAGPSENISQQRHPLDSGIVTAGSSIDLALRVDTWRFCHLTGNSEMGLKESPSSTYDPRIKSGSFTQDLSQDIHTSNQICGEVSLEKSRQILIIRLLQQRTINCAPPGSQPL